MRTCKIVRALERGFKIRIFDVDNVPPWAGLQGSLRPPGRSRSISRVDAKLCALPPGVRSPEWYARLFHGCRLCTVRDRDASSLGKYSSSSIPAGLQPAGLDRWGSGALYNSNDGATYRASA